VADVSEAVNVKLNKRKSGRVAQLVEQCPFKAWVEGSSPSALTTPCLVGIKKRWALAFAFTGIVHSLSDAHESHPEAGTNARDYPMRAAVITAASSRRFSAPAGDLESQISKMEFSPVTRKISRTGLVGFSSFK
jgi:hypothetical protein